MNTRSAMWISTLCMNALTMGLFSFASALSQIKLRDVCLNFPEASKGFALPAISELALNNQWLLYAMPASWACITTALIAMNWKRTDPPRDLVQLHTSATIFIGVLMLGLFVFAGVIPFISFTVQMRP